MQLQKRVDLEQRLLSYENSIDFMFIIEFCVC